MPLHSLAPTAGFSSASSRVGFSFVPDEQGRGCRLLGVLPYSPAQSSGLLRDDVVVRVNMKPTATAETLLTALQKVQFMA